MFMIMMIGAYGLYGACWSYVLFQRTYEKSLTTISNKARNTITILIIITLSAQLIYDICYYIYQYNQNISYASHAFGMFTGIMITVSLVVSRKGYIYKMIGVIGMMALLLEIIYLCYNHYHYWPPRPYIQSWLHNESSSNGCCSQLYTYMSKFSVSYDKALSSLQCIDDSLYPPF